MGTLIQKIACQPSVCVNTPPVNGPSAIARPATAAQMPMARARAFGSTNVCTMIDIATGFIIEPPSAWITRAVTSEPYADREAAQERAQCEQGHPHLEHATPAEAIRGGPAQHQEARDDDRVGIDHPLKPAERRSQVAADVRQRDVHDGGIHRDHQEAQAADGKDDVLS